MQAHLPFDIVSWITEESRQGARIEVPSNADEIEKEINEFRERLEKNSSTKPSKDCAQWTRGWKKWDGEWPTKPLGAIG